MSGNTFGQLFTLTSFGESHGPAIGGIIDGCPPGLAISEKDIQIDLDRRKPGTSKFVTQEKRMMPLKFCQVSLKEKQRGHPLVS